MVRMILPALALTCLVACDTTGDVSSHCAAMSATYNEWHNCVGAFESGEAYWTAQYQIAH